MEEFGVVKSIDGMSARVMVERRGGCCESCEKDACDIPDNGIETEAINAAHAKVGQKVKIVMRSHTFYKGALIIYVLPIVALIGGAILGKIYLPVFISVQDSDLLAALGGFIGLFFSFVVIKISMNAMDNKTEYRSVIESVLEDRHDRYNIKY